MGLIQFVKDAGSKLADMFDKDDEKQEAARKAAQEASNAALERDAKNAATGRALHALVVKMGLASEDLSVGFVDGRVTLAGTVPSQEVREKIILVVGNTHGVSEVDDQLTVEEPKPEATLYTVVRGDSLPRSRRPTTAARKYPVIFEANRPMLSDPDKIYPGQVLRIPPLDDSGAPLV
ncbi:MAG: peptidoglycan-binding protein LysM [Candidatus Eisenbacteria bacterium]